MAAASWLFVRGPESVRIVRQTATILNISGPGRARSERRFDGEAEVQAYQVRLAEEFSAAGFILIGENHERRSGRERRSMPRGIDRRVDVVSSAG
jgi:hypothetical protein